MTPSEKRLFAWAIRYIKKHHADALEMHRRIAPTVVRLEMLAARAWVKKAKAAVFAEGKP